MKEELKELIHDFKNLIWELKDRWQKEDDDKRRAENLTTPIPMEITIKKAENGYVITNKSNCNTAQEEVVVVSEEKFDIFSDRDKCENAEVEALREVFHYIQEQFGVSGGRYSKHRLYIVNRPGDKHNDFTNKDSEVLFATEDNPPKDAEVEVYDDDEEEKRSSEFLKEKL